MPRVATLFLMAALTPALPTLCQAQATLDATRGVSASAAILPEDTFLHFSVPDVDAFCDRFAETNGAGLYTGDETAALREKFLAFWSQANAMAQGQLGVTADEILANADGEFALAVTQSAGTPLSLVIMIGFEDQAIVDGLLDKVEAAYSSQGGEITRASVGGVEISTAAVPDGQVDSEAFSMNWFVADNKWVIGTNRGILEAVIDNWDGQSTRSLATNEIYEDMLEKVDLGQGRAPAMIAFFDPINLISEIATTVSQVNPEAAMPAGMIQGFLPQTGLQGLLGIMSATDFATEEGYEAVSKQFVYVEQPARGILEVFALDSGDQTPPAWVPADVASYGSFSWKVDGAYEAVERLVDNTLGQPGKTAEFLDQLRDMPGGPGIHVKEDILDQLDGTVRTMSVPSKEVSLDKLNGSQLFAFELVRSHNVPEVLARVAESARGELESRDYRGTTIYEFEMPTQSPTGEFSTQVGGIAVAQDSLVFATDIELMESVIRGDSDASLADSPLYQKAVDGVPSSLAALGFNDLEATLSPLYQFVKSDQMSDLIPDDDSTALLKMLIQDLPDFDSIQQYFGTAVGFSETVDDGLITTNRYFSGE